MFQVIKYSLIFLLLTLGLIALYIGIRQFKLSPEKSSFGQKIKKSVLFGFALSFPILLFFIAISIYLWDKANSVIDFSGVPSVIFFFAIPAFIIGSIGAFIQISYLEFLVYRKKKR